MKRCFDLTIALMMGLAIFANSSRAITTEALDNGRLTANADLFEPPDRPFVNLTFTMPQEGDVLALENFAVTEDGRLQVIRDFIPPESSEGAVRPVDIVFVHDDSNSLNDEAAQVKNNIENFLAILSTSDLDYRIGLVPYGGRGYDSFSPSEGRILNNGNLYSSSQSLIEQLESMKFDGGKENAFAALQLAVQGIVWRPSAQKVLILITDTGCTDRDPEEDDKSNCEEAPNESELIKELQDNNVTVYAVINREYAEKDFDMVVAKTGGEIFEMTTTPSGDVNIENFNTIIGNIGKKIANNYSIQYATDNLDPNGEERTVKLTVNTNDDQDNPLQKTFTATYLAYVPLQIKLTSETNTLIGTKQEEREIITIAVEIDYQGSSTDTVVSSILFYKNKNEEQFVSVPMTHEGNNIYQAIIPYNAVIDPFVKFYISATDGKTTNTLPSVDSTNQPFVISVLPNVSPVIIHNPVTLAQPEQNISISATITDATDQVSKVTLYYRKTGQVVYQSVPKTFSETNIVFEETIPDNIVTTNGVQYYLYAEDNNGASTTFGTLDEPINVLIVILPPIAEFIATPISGFMPLTVSLDGSSSSTSYSDGSIVDYQWQSTDGQPILPGAISSITYTQPGDYQITLTVTDNLGETHSTQQSIKVLISNQDALMVLLQGLGAEPISIDNRSISVVIAGETHRGLLAEQVIQGTSLSNNLIVEPIGDLNNDGIEDFLFTYPSGDQQVFYYFGTSNEPSQEALKRYFETFGAEAVVINADNSVSLTLNGKTYQGQLADEIVAGIPSSGFLSITPIDDDNNNDGVNDFEITYPSGERQIFYYSEPEPLTPLPLEVDEDTIDPDKLAVLRGRVTNRDGQPLSEVTISHPKFGETRTWIDGTFSLAVNGGKLFTLNYKKEGYLPAQRQVNTKTQIQGFFWADDVVMTPIERPQGPTVDLSATNTEPMQVVQGPPVETEEHPLRQGTLFFPQETTATLADGTTQLDELDVSITEYTIKDDDLAAMPVPLPLYSGYTYAVNISANGETDVKLSKPIPFYVNNFLGFETGTIVPLGRLDDTDQSRWVPAADGRVIKIVDIDEEGLAILDTIGKFDINELNITDAERLAIADQFQEGETFWRIVIDKLGDFDLNWPLKALEKLGIKIGEIASIASKLLDIDENPCVKSGCIIEAERQVLGEIIPVVGVPFNLNYRSSRTSGRYASYQLDIPLQDSSVDTPKRIKLEVSIGGQRISKVFSDNPSDNPEGLLNTPRYTYEWDGKEGYRSLHGQGRHKATVRIGYVYDGEYEVPPKITQSLIESIESGDIQCSTENPNNSDGIFGCISTTEVSSSIPARQEVTSWQEYTVNIDGWFPRSTGLGEWTIDVHHAYDPNGEVLYLGNGGLRQVAPIKQNDKILIASEDGGLVYEFSETGSHLRTIDSLTNKAIYTFSYLNGYLVKIEDIDGDITKIERDADKPLAIIAPYGQRTELDLNENGYLASVKNPAVETHKMLYTSDGLLTQFTNPRNNVAKYTYDTFGLLLEDTDFAEGGWKLARTENENPEENGYLVTMTSKEGRVSSFNVATLDDGIFQRVITAPDGTKTIVKREIEDDNKSRISERADGTTITLEEGPEPGRFGMQSPLVTNLEVKTPNGLVSTISTERIPELADENNPLSLQKLTEKVTVNGRTSSSVYDVSAKKMTATSAAGRESVSYLDEKGRVIREHTPNLADVHSSYDERGRLIETKVGDGLDARTATISYNNNGYISKVTDALDREVSFVYDAVGRVTTQVLTDGREIHYSYDTNGNVMSITPPGRQAHDFAYTPMDLQSQYTPPALADVSEPQTQYEYNLDKQLIRITRPDDRVVTFDYDAEKGRLNAITLPNRQLNYHYDAKTGNLNSIVSPDDTILMYTYDGSLALSETWGAGNPVLGRVSLTYDNDFRVASSQVNGRYTVNYEYDADSLLIRSGFLALDYHPQTGFLTDTHLGDLTTQREYNRFAEIESVTAAYKESALYQSEYGYDKLGRITQKTETIEGDEITYAYGYDDAGRLVEVTEDGAVTDEYSYDSNGNRLSADTSNGFFEGSYDEQDRLVQYGDTVYKYTANGELLSKDSGSVSTKYEYDVLGNLRTVKLADKQIEYIIDARSRRIGKRVDGKFTQGFLYQGSLNPIAELGVSGDVVTRFVYGSKANVPDYMLKGEKIYRILSDHLGSPRLVVDISDGTIVQRMDYDAFGNVVLDTNPGFQPFGFAGGIYDADTGLVRFGARDYDPETGRWTAKDPILFDGGDTNLYGYVVNDPVNLIDPSGQVIPLIGAAIGIVGRVVLGATARFVLRASPTFGRYVATNPVHFSVITSSAMAGSYFSDGSFIGKHFGAIKGAFEGAFGVSSAIVKGVSTAIRCDTNIFDEVMKNLALNYISGKIGNKLFGENVGKVAAPWIGGIIQKTKQE